MNPLEVAFIILVTYLLMGISLLIRTSHEVEDLPVGWIFLGIVFWPLLLVLGAIVRLVKKAELRKRNATRRAYEANPISTGIIKPQSPPPVKGDETRH